MLFAFAALLASCSRSDSRPSIVMFVFDTARADAMSTYGQVRNTTPEFDRLAASGLRYAHAYANSPWTLPSHVTMFTGLLVHQHGVGSYRGNRAPDDLLMLAERLRSAGYETAGFSENPFVSPAFNLAQGFERFENKRPGQTIADVRQPRAGEFNVQELVADWLRQRKGRRPFFLFVNVMDAHAPYVVRAENPFLPDGVDAESARAVEGHAHERICSALPSAGEVAVLKGLYLGGVASGDAKLRAVLAAIREAGTDENLVTIATSDHGEHFGEQRLMGHNFSVREALLRVPLVVSGLAGVSPAVIDQPVQLADLTPTVLHWIGAEVPSGLAGRPLPTQPSTLTSPGAIVAEYTEPHDVPLAGNEPAWLRDGIEIVNRSRSHCAVEDRVFGSMVALIRHPMKLIWFERNSRQLYDLSSDPEERFDLAPVRPDVATSFEPDLEAVLARSPAVVSPPPQATLPEEIKEQLRALGYLGETTGSATAAPD